MSIIGLLVNKKKKHAPTVGARFTNGKPLILPTETYEGPAVQEPSIIDEKGSVKVYYTAVPTAISCTVCLAHGPSIDGTLTKYGPVVGKGYGGAPANRQAMGSYTIKVNGYYYIYATNGYGFNSDGEDRNVYLYRSTDGFTFIDLGLVIDKTQITGATGIGNTSVLPTLVNGFYEMIIEAFVSGIWRLFRFRSTSLEGGWTLVGPLPSLQPVTNAMYGGANQHYVNGVCHNFYHYGTVPNGNLPTNLAYATSTDFATYTKRETPLKTIEFEPYGAGDTDQIADVCVAQVGTNTYLSASLTSNTEINGIYGFRAQVWIWTFNGGLKQVIS